jgi:hypothetical protein
MGPGRGERRPAGGNARLREVIARQDAELDATRGQIRGLRERLEAAVAQVEELTCQVGELKARLGGERVELLHAALGRGAGEKPAQPRQRGGSRVHADQNNNDGMKLVALRLTPTARCWPPPATIAPPGCGQHL